MSTEIVTVASSPPKRRWFRRLGIAAALLGVWVIFLYLLFWWVKDREVRAAVQEIQALEPDGWEFEDLEARRPKIPDSENAALVVMRISPLLPASWSSGAASNSPSPVVWTKRFREYPPQRLLNETLLADLEACLARSEPALGETRRLTGFTRGRYPLEWLDNIYLMSLQSDQARVPAQLLHFEAARFAHRGDIDTALSRIRGIHGAACSVGDEPFLISLMIRLFCHQEAVLALERTLAQGQGSPQALAELQELFERVESENLFLNALRGERAAYHRMFETMKRGDLRLSDTAALMGTGVLERSLMDVASPSLARRSHAPCLRLWTAQVEAAKLPLHEQPQAMEAVENQIKRAKAEYDIVTALLMPATLRVAERWRLVIGELRCAITALAAERFRLEHGVWPESLEHLVPQYLAEVPRDPDTGNPLCWVRFSEGWLIYGVGPDGIDDGGKLDRNAQVRKGYDEGFRLWDEKKRRQPPQEGR